MDQEVKSYAKVAVLMHGDLCLADLEDALKKGGIDVNVIGPVTTNTELLFEVRRSSDNDSSSEELPQDS